MEGVDGAISGRVADELQMEQELSPEEEKMYAYLVQDGKLRELAI